MDGKKLYSWKFCDFSKAFPCGQILLHFFLGQIVFFQKCVESLAKIGRADLFRYGFTSDTINRMLNDSHSW